ncbi:hypothetical protein JQX08_03025 [Pseudomonas sp. UL073]|uniref:DUF6316 domain-containing protein n=1 Tax=Zestomonas insulae TaxID=2809017 RepID=A0ABS2IA52_9GAMM|nr:DUF6316 family protein [Pseudomonas insulae]MBM7059670.1 hypothetical protein [Pseudomonas insulae]
MYGQREADLNAATHYRSDRVSSINGQFFFATREGTLEGPYFNRGDVEREIQRYIQRYQQAAGLIESRSF